MQPVRSLVRFFTADSADTRSKDWRPDLVLRRVIALPGDSVRMEDFIFYVRPEGSDGFVSEFEASGKRYPLVRETDGAEWARDLPFAGTTATVELADGEYFLATDNRTAGIDSRYGGPVERAAFRSRALLRYWPLDRFGTP
jgi:signal peptidase I